MTGLATARRAATAKAAMPGMLASNCLRVTSMANVEAQDTPRAPVRCADDGHPSDDEPRGDRGWDRSRRSRIPVGRDEVEPRLAGARAMRTGWPDSVPGIRETGEHVLY